MANRLSWNKYQIEEYRLEIEDQIKAAVTAYNE
jgi:glycerol-3-phosphate dehydrogenase